MITEIEEVLHAAERWGDVVVRPDRTGLNFIAGEMTFGHLRWDGRLDVPFPIEIRNRLVAEEMADCEPDESRRDRVVWIVRRSADVDRAVWLLRLSYVRSNGKCSNSICI